MSLEVLKQIREIETEALTIIENAHTHAAHMIAAATSSAAEEVEQARSQAKITIREAQDRATREAEEEIRHLGDRHAAQKDDIRREGATHMEQAVSLILERMIG